jgi:hypothetical protein
MLPEICFAAHRACGKKGFACGEAQATGDYFRLAISRLIASMLRS